MRPRRAATSVAVAALGLSACATAAQEEHPSISPMSIAKVRNSDGAEVARIRLTADAERRLGIETVKVTTRGQLLQIPLAAVFLDTKGTRWVYTRPEPRSYVRQAIGVAAEEGLTTFASKGPKAGTEIVTVGVPELWGAETGMDD